MDTTPSGISPGDTMANNMSNEPLDKTSQDFVMKAASGGMMEVQLGTMAQEKGQSDRVKAFGSMMVRDHSRANDELKSLTQSRGMDLTAMKAEHQKHVDDLGKKSAEEFDKAYMTMMVSDHKKDVSDFRNASKSLKDSTIKGFAARTLPVLQMHLDSAQAISKATQ
jgi:putative membrane protein